jgi:hypothetical protein
MKDGRKKGRKERKKERKKDRKKERKREKERKKINSFSTVVTSRGVEVEVVDLPNHRRPACSVFIFFFKKKK